MVEAEDLLCTNDEMIDHGDVMSHRIFHDAAGKIDILRTRGRIATRMIVHQYQRSGAQIQRTLDDGMHCDQSFRSLAVAHLLVADESIACIQVENPYPFVSDVAQIEPKVVYDVGHGRQQGASSYPRAKHMKDGRVEARYPKHCGSRISDGAFETGWRCRQNGSERAEFGQELIGSVLRIGFAACRDDPC